MSGAREEVRAARGVGAFDDSAGVYAEGYQQQIRVRAVDDDDPEIDESIRSLPREFKLVPGEYIVSSCANVNFSGDDAPCRLACSKQLTISGRTELITRPILKSTRIAPLRRRDAERLGKLPAELEHPPVEIHKARVLVTTRAVDGDFANGVLAFAAHLSGLVEQASWTRPAGIQPSAKVHAMTALRRNQLAGLPNQRERWSSRSC